MSRLLLVRHGETELNSSQRYWGTTDVPLGTAGLRQAEQLRNRLAGEMLSAVYSSELKRAATTAGIISSARLPVTVCSELREIHFGEIEGLTFAEVAENFPEVARMWIQRSPQMAYPGGESLEQLDNRIAEFIARLGRHDVDETVLVVAHAGVLRTLICQLLELDLKHRWNLRIDLASLSIVETYPEGAILSLLNDTSHLREEEQ